MEEPEDILEDIIEEPEKEINDILTFFKKKRKSGKIPLKRGGLKDNQEIESDQQEFFEESLLTLKDALSEERSTSSRKICKGIWYKSPINKIKIITARGNHLHNMGHSINGQIWLYPEEALFLLERGMLTIEFKDVPVSIQQAYMLMMTGDEFITLEKYQVYTYLKRIGFTVMRPPSQSQSLSSTNSLSSSPPDKKNDSPSSHESNNQENQAIIKNYFSWRLSSFKFWLLKPFTYISRYYLFSKPPCSSRLQINPIVEPESCDTYEQVFKKLQIIQRSKDADIGLTANELKFEEDNQEDYKIDFYVHRQSQDKKFKKKSPGEPLFRVVVASAMVQKPPSIKTLEKLFKDNGFNLSAKNNSILFSIVDGENVVFLEFKDIIFGDIKVDLVRNN
ncbi:hypothetical protein Glove_415g9 [Diversispora epigaea]|uniref:tRNA-splicing endonuclease subunit Sen54 N-terminal domain-containing protein n=1 Tax=Diversispora epigaea TaxID=1348612 RepID=A0A397H212_9GLOM|nr:hypothetical protein Glove_415g9 [Diversispora epigaea]